MDYVDAIGPLVEYSSCKVNNHKTKKDMSTYPCPEIELYGPPVICTGRELAGTLHLNLATKADLLREVTIRLEAAVVTSSSGSETRNRQKKRLYSERHTVWSGLDTNITHLCAGENKWEFGFAMPPGHLPPSFRLNANIYICYSLRAVAHFTNGKRMITLNLEHNPVQTVPDEEQWGLSLVQSWITISNSSKMHSVVPSQAALSAKLSAITHSQIQPMPRLGFTDKLKGRKLYPVKLQVMYLESGASANAPITPLKIQLLRDQLPMPRLKLKWVQVQLNVITKVLVNKCKYMDKSCRTLVEKPIDKDLPGDVSVDLTRLIGTVTLPQVEPTFNAKTLARSYQLVISCRLLVDDHCTMIRTILPLTVFGNSEDDLLPVYCEDLCLPKYSEIPI